MHKYSREGATQTTKVLKQNSEAHHDGVDLIKTCNFKVLLKRIDLMEVNLTYIGAKMYLTATEFANHPTYERDERSIFFIIVTLQLNVKFKKTQEITFYYF